MQFNLLGMTDEKTYDILICGIDKSQSSASKSRNQSNLDGCQFSVGIPMERPDNFRSKIPFKVDNFMLHSCFCKSCIFDRP